MTTKTKPAEAIKPFALSDFFTLGALEKGKKLPLTLPDGMTADAASKVKSPFSGNPAFMALALEDRALDAPLLIAYPDAFNG